MKEFGEVTLIRITPEEKTERQDRIVREVPFTILLNGKELVTLQCTPSNLEYLAVGFLLSEGLVSKKEAIKRIVLNEKGWYIHIDVEDSILEGKALYPSRVIGSGCAGVVSFYRSVDVQDTKPLDSQFQIGKEKIFLLMKDFQQRSSLFKETGGVHSCALSSQEEIKVFAEDIGRHNAVDKVLGECFLKEIATQDKVLLTSGRVTSEILIKVAKQGIPVLISPAAPTDLAIGLAEKLKVTVVGFVRGKRMNVYTQEQRII